MASIEEQCARADRFARRMKERLRANAGKGDWRDTVPAQGGPLLLIGRAQEGLEEADRALAAARPDPEVILDACADVANCMLMAADLSWPQEAA